MSNLRSYASIPHLGIWANGLEGLAVLDTQSGAVGRITSGDLRFWGYRVIGTDGNSRIVVLGLFGSLLVADVHPGRVRLDPGQGSYDLPIVYASARDLLFVAKRASTTPGSSFGAVDVIDASTGRLVKTIDVSAVNTSAFGGRLAVNAEGTRLFVSAFGSGTIAFDVASGTVVASNPSLTLAVRLDEQRNRLITTIDTDTIAASITAFSADSLGVLGSVSLPAIRGGQRAATSTRDSERTTSKASRTRISWRSPPLASV